MEISVIKGECGKLSIKYGQEGFKVSKESLENNIAKNIDLLKKENASESVDDSMLNVAKDIDQFKTKDAGESKQGRKESHEAYKKRKEEYHKIKEEYSKKEKRFKELANKILESSAGANLEKLNAKYTSKEVICRVVKRVVTEKTKSEEEVRENFNEETLIGSNDAREIRKNFKSADEVEKFKVKIEKTEKKSSEKVEDASVDGINQVNKVDGNQEQNKITPQDVHNFVADMILNDDAFTHDKNVLKPGERFRQTLIKHSGTITALLNDENKKLLDTVDDNIRDSIESFLDGIRKGYEVYWKDLESKTAPLKSFVSFFTGEEDEPEEQRNPAPMKVGRFSLIGFFIAMPPDVLSKMEEQINDAVEDAANQMQDNLSEQLKSICSDNSNVGKEVNYELVKVKFSNIRIMVFSRFGKNEKQLSSGEKEILNKIADDATKICDLCEQSKSLGFFDEELEPFFAKMRKVDKNLETGIKNAKGFMNRIKYTLLKEKLENALSYLEKDGENIDGFKSEELIVISKIIEDLKNGKEVTNEMINGSGDYESNDRGIDPIKLKEDLKREISNWNKKFSIWNVEFNTLKTLMAQSGTDLNSDGYGKFMQNVMGRYMMEIPLIDKRSMVAARIKYYQKSKPPTKSKENDEDYKEKLGKYLNDKKAFEVKEASKKFGAILKGAGQIMQKMLQGLKTGDEEFDGAIEDMKSSLAPINEEMIKVHLYDAVEKSNGQIKNITVKRSLGAASVGRALLCEIEDKGGNKKECVVKLLRPDVYNRAMREKEIFEQASKEIPGMEITFNGQLKSIMDELDLTKEAKNVEDGKVYDNTFNDVKSMNIIRPPEPTKNILILEKAPGQTIDSYINKGKEGSVYKNVVDIIDKIENRKDKLATSEEAVSLKGALDELLRAQRALINLSTVWVTDGIYKNGFYHGDLHAGNMMIDPNIEETDTMTGEAKRKAKLTVIDFGNATRITKDQQSDIMLMMSSASVGDEELFMKGFRRLLIENGKKIGTKSKIFSEEYSKKC